MGRNIKSKILVIAAHPDDEVLGVGGTISWFSTIAKADVFVLILTEGCSSQYKGDKSMILKKRREAERANKILGVKKVIFGDLPDMRLDSLLHVQINEVIEKQIRAISPDIVFTQHPDVNKDHVLVFESTMVAIRPSPGASVKKVYTYASASSTEWSAPLVGSYFIPNIFFDISDTLDLKLKAFSSYNTELRKYPHPRAIESIKIYAEREGIAVGLKAAESFMLIRSIES